MKADISRAWTGISVAAILGLWCAAAQGQDRAMAAARRGSLVVDGIVREVFRSPRQDRVDFLVQIEVTRTQANRVPRTPPRVAVPAPGDMVYVHASQRSANGQGQGVAGQNAPSAEARPVVPAERSQVALT